MENQNGKNRVRMFIVIAAIVAAGVFLAIYAVAQRPLTIHVALNCDAVAQRALTEAITEYAGENKKLRITILNPGDEGADLTLDASTEGSVPWRSIGWRLWARLETVAALEGSLNQSIIRRLRDNSLSKADLDAVLLQAKKKAIAPFVLPEQPKTHEQAFVRYSKLLMENVAPGTVDWEQAGLVTRVKDLRTVVDLIANGKALFLIGPDSVGAMLGRANDNHPEGFALPGSRDRAAAWVIGRTEAFSISPTASSRTAKAAADLVTYLTSQGLARAFAMKLGGEFHSWTESPKPGTLPTILGPTQFIDPEQDSAQE